MIANIAFLIIVILLAGVTSASSSAHANNWSVWLGVLGVSITLLLITLQNRLGIRYQVSQPLRLWLANIELVTVLGFFAFTVPIPDGFSALTLLLFLGIYFAGLFVFYRSSDQPALPQIRWLVPFAFPAVFFSVVVNLADTFALMNRLPINETWQTITVGGLTIAFLLGITLIMPLLIVRVWRCKSLPNGPLRDRLMAICSRAGFAHRGLMLWNDIPRLLNAAIVGIFPHFRFVLFTPRLLQRLSSEEVEAILGHEIGHNRHRHLLIYPFLMLGLLTWLWLFEIWGRPLVIQMSAANETFAVFLTFIAEALLIFVYIRFVLSYFSRLFERQADLYVFELGGNPQALINALDQLAIHAGNIHDRPNWHHGRVRDRMNFLTAAMQDPKLMNQHQIRVRWALIGYMVIAALLAVTVYSFY